MAPTIRRDGAGGGDSDVTVNPAAFYGLAALIVGGSMGVVSIRLPRHAAVALAGTGSALAVLEAVSGARVLAIVQFLVILGVGTVVVRVARRGGAPALEAPGEGIARWWPVAAAVAVLFAVLLIWTFGTSNGSWRHGGAPAALISVFHQREPLVLGIIAVLVATAVAGSRVIAGVSDDERELDRRIEARRTRDERTRRRREDREAARRRGGPAAGEGTR